MQAFPERTRARIGTRAETRAVPFGLSSPLAVSVSVALWAAIVWAFRAAL